MSKQRVAILKIITGQTTVTAAAREYGINRRHLHRLLKRAREHGIDAIEPQSRRPHTNPHTTPEPMRARIITL